jgi:tetratricopeptide (TPR) repeat protein
MFTRIPNELRKFSDFINATDDCQSSPDTIGFTIYPKTPEGKTNYSAKEDLVEIKDQPNYKRWDWTDTESKTWSNYRKKFDAAFAEHSQNKSDSQLKTKCEALINELITYDQAQGLLNRVAESGNTTQKQSEIFNIRPDTLKIKTSLRTIEVKYEKQLPLNDFETTLLENIKALNESAFGHRKQSKKLQTKIKNLMRQLSHLWEQYPILKDKADKATNRLFIPSPKMKGAMSDVVAFQMPTQEEAKKNHENFMEYSQSFSTDYMELYNTLQNVELEEKKLYSLFEEDDNYEVPVYKEMESLYHKLFEDGSCVSLDLSSLYDEEDAFRELLGEISAEVDEMHEEWCNFVDRFNLLNTVYSNFVKFTNAEFGDNNDEEDDDEGTESKNPFTTEDNEMDELQAETMKRYKDGQENNSIPYFDTADWHVILDNFERRYDRKNFSEAMEQALTQHPEDTTMQIRKAQELANEHQYQPALDLLKKAEAQGPPHHPKLFFVKATVYRNLQSPDLAIPQYMRIINQDNLLLIEWKRHAYENLIDIYDVKKNYDECLRLALELLALFPDDELIVEKAAWAYNAAGKSSEGEEVLRHYLEYHPKSADAYNRLGHILVDKKEYRKAIECYDKAFALDRNELYEALYYKGLALMELKEYDEAAINFEHCLLYFKISVEFHVGAAKAYDKAGMQEQVIYHYRQALAIDPDCKEAVDYLLELNKKKINS